jgi:hypothetical protein
MKKMFFFIRTNKKQGFPCFLFCLLYFLMFRRFLTFRLDYHGSLLPPHVMGVLRGRQNGASLSCFSGLYSGTGSYTCTTSSAFWGTSDKATCLQRCQFISGSGMGSQTGSHSGVPDAHSRRISMARSCASLRCCAVRLILAYFCAVVRGVFRGVDMAQVLLRFYYGSLASFWAVFGFNFLF